MPTINLEQIIETVGQSISTTGQIAEKAPVEKPTGKTKGMKRSSTSNKKECKKTKIDWKNVSAIDFSEYLKTLRRPQSINVDQEAIIQQSIMPTDNVDEMGVFLKQKYAKIEDDETILMSNYLQLGVYLRDAQKRFKRYKKESKDEITWYEWLYEKVKISGEKARQLTGLAKLVEEYPKLKDLQISFTCMRAMKTKIESVFKSNPKIALEWK
jgi:DNA replicative helicase MCM subunit Mcm2 (Cdc46/Mcm family)